MKSYSIPEIQSYVALGMGTNPADYISALVGCSRHVAGTSFHTGIREQFMTFDSAKYKLQSHAIKLSDDKNYGNVDYLSEYQDNPQIFQS